MGEPNFVRTPMPKFLLKTPDQNHPANQLDELLQAGGNYLVLASGYLGVGGKVQPDFKKIVEWLKDEDAQHPLKRGSDAAAFEDVSDIEVEHRGRRELLIIFGAFGKFRPISRAMKNATSYTIKGAQFAFFPDPGKLSAAVSMLNDLFSANFLPGDVADRIQLVASANFHAKFMYLEDRLHSRDRRGQPCALQMGSSNFSGQGRYDDQIEFDVYYGPDDAELAQAADVAKSAMAIAQTFKVFSTTAPVEKAKLAPWRRAIAQAEKEAYQGLVDDCIDRQWAREEADWNAQAAEVRAQRESDIAQGIGPG